MKEADIINAEKTIKAAGVIRKDKTMELWDLYDKERKKTGKTLERGMPIPKGYYHLCVSVWIVNSKGEFLLSQRHPDKKYPLLWECTGGSVLAGEDSLEGALREVKEELGIVLEPKDGKVIYQTRREDIQDFYDAWLFHHDAEIEDLQLQETEVIGAKWVDQKGLLELYNEGKLHPLLDYMLENGR